MKLVLSNARALLAGIALIVATNAVVLAGVAYNRSGEPESVLRLTERELQIRNWDWPANENSSIDVYLSWRVARDDSSEDDRSGGWTRGLQWLQPAQLRELGFDISGDLESDAVSQRIARQPSRRAWLVLEHDGLAFQESLERSGRQLERAVALAAAHPGDRELQERLESARAAADREARFATRLFVVDAGRDENALRVQYPDRRHYVILGGRLDVSVVGPPGGRRLTAYVAEIDAGAIRVPHVYRAIVEPFAQSEGSVRNREPRFAATVNFGRRFEPWIVDLGLLE